MQAHKIINQVVVQVTDIHRAFAPALKLDAACADIAYLINLQVCKIPLPKLIKMCWMLPDMQIAKIYCDGASKATRASQEEELRDHQGRVIDAFGSFYGIQTNTWAEAKAAWEGLHAAWQQKLTNV